MCASDVHAVRGTFRLWPPPIVLGHEAVGVVEAVGDGVTSAARGQMVALSTSISCGSCFHCREGEELLCPQRRLYLGGFAEYALAPSAILYATPAGVTWKAAVLAEPVTCVLHACGRLGLRPGELVAVIGGGTMGLLAVQLCSLMGAAVVVSEPNAERRELAVALGARVAADPATEDLTLLGRGLTGGVGFDRVLEAVGTPGTVEQSLACVRRGGTVVLMGVADREARVTVSPYDLYSREVTIRGSFIRTFEFQRAVRLLPRLVLEPLVTHEFPLERIEEAVANVEARRGVKTIVLPHGSPP
jgi:threonine dehydrogenase-like Zn-dependent dehydrogenase